MKVDVRIYINKILYSKEFTVDEKAIMVLELLEEGEINVLSCAELLVELGLLKGEPIVDLHTAKEKLYLLEIEY